MSSSHDRWMRLWALLSRRRLRREVDEELEFHLEMLARRFESRGMGAEAARQAAVVRFGDPARARRQALRAEAGRIQRQKRGMIMDELGQDLRIAVRQLWQHPAFSAIALAMLALGIGANTAIFSVVYTVLLRPLPFAEPERIVQVWESRLEQGWERASVAPGNFWDLREMNQAFEELGAYRWSSANLTGGEFPERLRVGRVSAGFFGRVLGTAPVLGRDFLPGEDQPGGESRIALLGHQFWQTRFGGSREALGARLTLDGESVTIVGVLPPGGMWLAYGDVYLPMVRRPEDTRSSFELAVVGRLRPGITMEAGRADLEAVARRLEEAFPQELKGIGIAVAPSSEWVADADTRRALWVLLGAVGFLLMIACVNLANLLLARATGRMRETAIRAAAGASRARLLRQGLTESLFLSLLGAGLGLAFALWGIDALTALAPEGIPRLSEVGVSGWVLTFTLGVAVATGVLTGLLPALQGAGQDAAAILRSGGHGIAGNRTQRRLRGALVASEVALSLVLLVGAGLLVRSFGELLEADLGFEAGNRLVATLNLPGTYSREEGMAFIQQLTERASALPGVVSAAAVSARPLGSGDTGLGFVRPDLPLPEGGTPWASWRMVTPGYFRTLGLPILRGRDLNADDLAYAGEGSLPIVISQRMAELLWPGEDPLGRTVTLWAGQDNTPGEVLGVVGDMRERGIEEGPTLAVYLPYLATRFGPELVVHTAGDPLAVVSSLRALLSELDPDLPLYGITTLEELVGSSVGSHRFLMTLVGLFATLALLLAVAGVYGVQACSVARQSAEIGVRVAMGASRRQIVGKIVVQAMRPAATGAVVGVGGALVLSRSMATLLFEVEPGDPGTYAVVGATILTAALVSAWLPARRAARVDPAIAFRAE